MEIAKRGNVTKKSNEVDDSVAFVEALRTRLSVLACSCAAAIGCDASVASISENVAQRSSLFQLDICLVESLDHRLLAH